MWCLNGIAGLLTLDRLTNFFFLWKLGNILRTIDTGFAGSGSVSLSETAFAYHKFLLGRLLIVDLGYDLEGIGSNALEISSLLSTCFLALDFADQCFVVAVELFSNPVFMLLDLCIGHHKSCVGSCALERSPCSALRWFIITVFLVAIIDIPEPCRKVLVSFGHVAIPSAVHDSRVMRTADV